MFIVLFLPFTWFMVTSVFFKPGFPGLKESKEVFASELRKLGQMNKKEKIVATVLLLLFFFGYSGKILILEGKQG
jgi:di/tricarboxylate transporter